MFAMSCADCTFEPEPISIVLVFFPLLLHFHSILLTMLRPMLWNQTRDSKIIWYSHSLCSSHSVSIFTTHDQVLYIWLSIWQEDENGQWPNTFYSKSITRKTNRNREHGSELSQFETVSNVFVDQISFFLLPHSVGFRGFRFWFDTNTDQVRELTIEYMYEERCLTESISLSSYECVQRLRKVYVRLSLRLLKLSNGFRY